ncbi:hypothetical protein [Microbacterium album]|uniref:Gram-positive cocci surface proteins LPxTG domain-containing protein n=1 Tax=Microbacterium album TaxID=2053191 RepID=A0A917MKG5_9MICO|nr:hypothetical protein [Microbacterium album]GGH36644.1 hypothetical protein GCM10010921_05940 [Microbacterium album]
MTAAHRRMRRGAGAALVAAGAVLAVGAGSSLVAHADAFTPAPVQSTPDRLLTLSSRHAPAPHDVASLSPGDPGYWIVRAEHDDKGGSASVALQVAKRGPLAAHPRGLTMSVEQCLAPWHGVDEGSPRCDAPGGSLTVTPAHDLADDPSPAVHMLELDSADPHYFLVTLSVEDSAEARADETLQALGAIVDLGVTAARAGGPYDEGARDAPRPGPADAAPGLAATGADPAAIVRLAALALSALAIGAGLRLLRRRPGGAS